MATIRQIGSILEKAFNKWDYDKAIKLSSVKIPLYLVKCLLPK